MDNTNEYCPSYKLLLFNRLKIASFGMLVLSFFYLYVDFVLYKGISATPFHITLLLIHLTGFLASVIYLCLYYGLKNSERFHQSEWVVILANTYVSIYIASSALASLNSYRLAGTIEAYLIVLIAVPVILPIRPKHFFIILSLCHTLFLLGLAQRIDAPYTLISKQINSTLAVFLSFLTLIIQYSYHRKNFLYLQQRKESEERIRKLFDITPFPLVLSRLDDGKIILANKTATHQYPAFHEHDRSTDVHYVFHDRDERAKLVAELQESGSIKNFIIKKEEMPDVRRWMMVNYELIDYQGETCILSGITDITQLKTFEEELVQHASIDPLTGIRNRRSGMAVLEKVLSQTYTNGTSCIVCFIDINNLKEVNDTFGHLAGDELIATVCRVISGKLASVDLMFRYGGDEFIVLFFNKQLCEVELIWDSICQSFQEMNQTGKRPYLLSASHGLFRCEAGMNLSSEEVIEKADKEMYKEKVKMKEASSRIGMDSQAIPEE